VSSSRRIPRWSIAAPVAGAILFGAYSAGFNGVLFAWLAAAGLVAGILAAVYHAECIAHILGEPFGTMVLALAITLIEVGLIVTLMIVGGASAEALARDTVFAATMLILNGIIGACLLVGGFRHHEQEFKLHGASAALTTLAAISVLTLVLPNFTLTTPGPYYSQGQLAAVAVVSLALYATFALVQGSLHRDYFLQDGEAEVAAEPANRGELSAVTILLLASLATVVLLAKALSPFVERGVGSIGAPQALVGIIIAAVVLAPEGFAALRAAYGNRLQTSLNLALGSALASIGLTIPSVAIVSMVTDWPLRMGLDPKSMVLLALSLFAAALSLGTGRTTILQGVVHLVILVIYLVLTIVP
jgi:Ca2+:H+ antiporter